MPGSEFTASRQGQTRAPAWRAGQWLLRPFRLRPALQRNRDLWDFCAASENCVHRVCLSATLCAAIGCMSKSASRPAQGGGCTPFAQKHAHQLRCKAAQTKKKVEGNVTFYPARSTAFRSGSPESPGRIKNVAADKLRSVLGLTSVTAASIGHERRLVWLSLPRPWAHQLFGDGLHLCHRLYPI